MKLKKILPTVLSVAVASMLLMSVGVSAVETKTDDKITTLNFLPSNADDLDEFFIPPADDANEYEYKDGVFTITRTADNYSQVTLDLEQAGYEIIFDLTKDLILEYDFEVKGSANIQIVTPSDIDFKFAAPDPKEGDARPAIRFGSLPADKNDIIAGQYTGSVNLKDLADRIDSDGELFIRQIWFYTIGKDTVVTFKKFQLKGTSLGDKIGEVSSTPTEEPTETSEATPTVAPTTAAPTTVAPTTAKASTPTPTKATDNTPDANDGGSSFPTWAIIVIAAVVVVAAGGLLYYFLVVKKKNK